MSAAITTLDERIPPYIQSILRRDAPNGKAVPGGMVTAKDSNWQMSWIFPRQSLFCAQPRGQLVGWIHGLCTDRAGNFIKKPMRLCSGQEICMEWGSTTWGSPSQKSNRWRRTAPTLFPA